MTFKEEIAQISGIWHDGSEREHAIFALKAQGHQLTDFKARWWSELNKISQVQYLLQDISLGRDPLDVLEAIQRAVRNA